MIDDTAQLTNLIRAARREHPDIASHGLRALRRTAYDTAHEREAETVATIILEWASSA